MTLNRRRVALPAVIAAMVIGWAGSGVASATSNWDGGTPDTSKWDSATTQTSKWD
jgi:hypothetical protein